MKRESRMVRVHEERAIAHSPLGGLDELAGLFQGASHVVMSRSTVVYDGQQTHVRAEEQALHQGEWEQRSVEGVLEGDQRQVAIERITRARSRGRLGRVASAYGRSADENSTRRASAPRAQPPRPPRVLKGRS